ncbi:MAG: hypothetical protein KA965_03995 [Butyrivibrio sp.]|nr:hypothetical protein [Butyrivibrio sp.]
MRVDKTDVMQSSMAAAENGMHTSAQKNEADSSVNADEVKSISAAQMSFPGDDIKQRQDAAKKKSWDIISRAYAGESKIDDTVQKIRDDTSQKKAENSDSLDQIAQNNDRIDNLQKQYGVDPDSKEQKDLELMEKASDAMMSPGKQLTKEEQAELGAAGANGLTEYQQRAMEIYGQNTGYQKQINDNMSAIMGNNASLTGIKLERLKSHTMADAQTAAKQVMDAANQDIVGVLTSNTIRKEDDRQEKEAEKTKKQQEENQKKQDDADTAKAKDAAQEEMIQKIREKGAESAPDAAAGSAAATADAGASVQQSEPEQTPITLQQTQQNVNREIDAVLTKMKMMTEDIKGEVVDSQI